MKIIETYKCDDCKLEFGINESMWEQPSCPRCGEHLDVLETTENLVELISIDELLTELEIEAKELEAQNNYPLAAKTELLIIQIRKLLKEKNHVS